MFTAAEGQGSSTALLILILNSQPSPMGEALTRPGSPTTRSLVSTTSPLTGAKTSAAALTDSTVHAV